MEPFEVGTAVEKTNSLREHVIRDGTKGIVKSAVGPCAPGGYGYFVQFEHHEAQVFVADTRLKLVTSG
jgi:hypothetical protein